MENIEEQINEKIIEKDTDDIPQVPAQTPDPPPQSSPPVEKKKKERTPAQKEAFEKARKKRAENYQKRKALKEQTKIKEVTSLNQADPKTMEDLRKSATEPLARQRAVAPPPPQEYGHWNAWQQPPQPIINNYYYGAPQPESPVDAPTQPKKTKKKKEIMYESSSEEEEEEEEQQQAINPFLKNKLKPQKNNLVFKYT